MPKHYRTIKERINHIDEIASRIKAGETRCYIPASMANAHKLNRQIFYSDLITHFPEIKYLDKSAITELQKSIQSTLKSKDEKDANKIVATRLKAGKTKRQIIIEIKSKHGLIQYRANNLVKKYLREQMINHAKLDKLRDVAFVNLIQRTIDLNLKKSGYVQAMWDSRDENARRTISDKLKAVYGAKSNKFKKRNANYLRDWMLSMPKEERVKLLKGFWEDKTPKEKRLIGQKGASKLTRTQRQKRAKDGWKLGMTPARQKGKKKEFQTVRAKKFQSELREYMLMNDELLPAVTNSLIIRSLNLALQLRVTKQNGSINLDIVDKKFRALNLKTLVLMDNKVKRKEKEKHNINVKACLFLLRILEKAYFKDLAFQNPSDANTKAKKPKHQMTIQSEIETKSTRTPQDFGEHLRKQMIMHELPLKSQVAVNLIVKGLNLKSYASDVKLTIVNSRITELRNYLQTAKLTKNKKRINSTEFEIDHCVMLLKLLR